MTDMISPGTRILLDLIYRTETGRPPPFCYTTIIGHREHTLQKPITAMTIDELLAAQKAWGKKWKSSAAGAPQIIRATMVTLVKRLGFSGGRKFTAETQDMMAFELLRMRGWQKFVAGEISVTAFGNNLAREWASFPVLTAMQGAHGHLKRGQSYYDGDGLNSALIAPEKVEETLRLVLAAESKPADAPAAPEAAKPAPMPQPQPAPAPDPVVVEKPVVADPGELEKHPLKSKTVWTWLITTVIAPLLAVFQDRYVQLAIVALIALFAVYAIKRRFDLYGAVKRLRDALGAVAIGALLLWPPPAKAHDAPSGWAYPYACCANYDCRQEASGEVLERPEGYVIAGTGEVIPMTDRRVRQSPDGYFHWCAHQAGLDKDKTICLFVPPRSF